MPAQVPMEIQHSIQSLRDSVLVGTATSRGDLIAVLEASGKVKLLRLDRGRDGGLYCHSSQHRALEFGKKLSRQEIAPPTSLKFQETLHGVHIFAIDLHGKLIVKTVVKDAYPPHELDSSTQTVELAELGDSRPIFRPAGNHITHQLEDSVAPNRYAPTPYSQTQEFYQTYPGWT